MSINSTSLINFSGDKKLNFFQAILWLFGNILNNFFPNINTDKRIKNLKFKYFYYNHKKLMNIIEYEDIDDFLEI